MNFKDILLNKILVLDGAMGTMIQEYGLKESDFRGEKFKDWNINLKGCNDILVLTNPDKISEIHHKYLEAGADIIETNTFNSTSVSLDDYALSEFVEDINFNAALLAKKEAELFTKRNPEKPRFVAGSIGPTNKTTSLSPDVDNPAFRSITFDQLKLSYKDQIKALIKGGVDLLLIETIFDTLNAKAAINASIEAMSELEKEVPIMLSVTLSDKGGRTLSGQTLHAFLASVMHAPILSVGLNCSFGADEMKSFVKQLGDISPYFISAYPNAGLPNRFGEYDETPEIMGEKIGEFLNESLVNIIGGCCGTTPEHIRIISEKASKATPHIPSVKNKGAVLSGLEILEIKSENNFINIGERCNVAGSRKFLRLINEGKYDEALSIARNQVEDGAQIIDINMDDAMLDSKKEMIIFLNLIASEPDICRAPLMIDSSKFDILEEGLKCIQGKSIVNSISLKEGEETFLKRAEIIKSLGASVVVMAFDEAGQADSFERKTEVCERAYKLLTEKINFNPEDIIFDPNVLAIATGIKEHNNYAVNFIEATAWIKANLPGAKVSGGVSNLSFSFRGNNYLREVMHSVFLYHAIKAGMDMGIVNPSASINYDEIPADILTLVEDVILNRNEEATDKLIDLADELKNNKIEKTEVKEVENLSVEDRLINSLKKGISDHLENDIAEALIKYKKAVEIIDGPLMEGMNQVGELFGSGKMFLPQVVKSARTMKKAVEILQPVIEKQKEKQNTTSAGKYLLATVKGDVHDIGKNIVSVILACNNYEVIDLGVMVPTDDIIKAAIDNNVDFIGLSGLITPSLEEMCNVAKAMEKASLKIPLMIGGATTSKIHTAVKIAPNYSGPVFHLNDAAQNPIVSSQLNNPAVRDKIIGELKKEQNDLRNSIIGKKEFISYNDAISGKLKINWNSFSAPVPINKGITDIDKISISYLRDFINWRYFFSAWKIIGNYSDIAEIHGCDSCKAVWLNNFPEEDRAKAGEAMKLYKDANELLDYLQNDLNICLKARTGIFKAYSENENIIINTDKKDFIIPCLRQQVKKSIDNGNYLSLADFIAPKDVDDYIGVFVVSVGEAFEKLLSKYKSNNDDYKSLLLQSLGDRLVEAASEWLHFLVRTETWGYSKDENLTITDMKKARYKGIRPAVGYPSLPDQSLNFILNDILDFSETGVTLTEHGAMYPNASISGLYFANPEANYFLIGDIDNDQLNSYSKRKNSDIKEVKKYLNF